MQFGVKSSVKAFGAALLALIVCSNVALTGGASQNQVDSKLTAGSIRFSFKLYDEIRKQQRNKNTFISPASAMLALAMTYNGADGTTRQAMARALEIDGMSVDDVNRAFADLKSTLAPADPKIQLKIANSLWANNGFALNPAFVKRNEQHFDAEIASLDFSDPSAAGVINSWVNKNTEGKIQKIVERIKPEDVLFLINAIYFKAQWKFEFKKENTKNDAFRVPGGEPKQIPVTSVVISLTSVQQPREKFVMKVDRPFFFAIRDNQTGVVLFMGSITNPA